MQKREFSFLSLSHSFDMIYESSISTDDFFQDLIMLFVKKEDIDEESHKINIQALQQNTPELRAKIDLFIEKYKTENIKIFKLRSYFQKLTNGENFIIWPNGTLTSEQRNQLYMHLTALKRGEDYNNYANEINELFGEVKNTYITQAFDENTKRTIGEQDKSKRICRFCGKTRENVSFKNIAHAISESLGNKKIILNEECDECNSFFGSASGIESSLLTFLRIYSIFFGISGKNGVPKLKGRNFELSNDGHIQIKKYSENDDEIEKEEDSSEIKMQLDTNDNIIMQDIYKALCKYFLSVIDSRFLPEFAKTINWINGQILLSKIPKIAILTSYRFFKKHPSLITFIRKDNNTDIPYAIGEFHFTFLTFVFILPLTKPDNKDFTEKDDYDKFWSFFKHYKMTKGWEYKDFSSNKKRKFSVNLNFKQKENKEDIT